MAFENFEALETKVIKRNFFIIFGYKLVSVTIIKQSWLIEYLKLFLYIFLSKQEDVMSFFNATFPDFVQVMGE